VPAGDVSLVPILIADDEAEDRYFLEKALRKAGAKNPIIEFHDGADLLEFLRKETAAQKSIHEIATLLLLDIKMPLVDGFDAMRWIRDDPVVNLLRIAIVSSSSLPRDQEKAAELGAISYLEKYPSSAALGALLAQNTGAN
jgi:CheY-like chemotaxis protein